MRKKCNYCEKSRSKLMYAYIFLILSNALIRSYFGYKLETLLDLLLIPSSFVALFAIIIVLVKYRDLKFSENSSQRNH